MANIDLESPLLCSICLEDVSGICDRTAVTLQCSHFFHLDCIGSAFNASGSMRCPNCRQVENGRWWGFQNDNAESNIEEVDNNEGFVYEGVHSFIEMEPSYGHSSPVDRLLAELYVLTGQVINGEFARFGGNVNFNPYMVGPVYPSEIAASPVLPGHNPHGAIAHQAILYYLQQISAHAVPWYDPRTDPIGRMYQEYVSRQAVLDSITQSSFRPSVGSGSFGNNGPIYGNYTRVLPPSNLPSPAVRNTAAGRSAINGLQHQSLAADPMSQSEVNQRFSHITALLASQQRDPQQHNNTTPPVCFCGHMVEEQAAPSEHADDNYLKRLCNCWRSID